MANKGSLFSEYIKKKANIKKRLKDFSGVWCQSEERLFSELCFCICTPQSKAVYCDKSISALERTGVLFKGGVDEIRAGLTAVRFPNNKARYIVEAREFFTENGRIKVRSRIDERNIFATRHWLVKNVKGLGYKEASHFLRNIGFGHDIAILDVHILRNMLRYGAISRLPKTITEKKYLFIENKLKEFANNVNIPVAEIDLLFWSAETGEIFK